MTIETNIDFEKAKSLTLNFLKKHKKIDCIFCMSDEILTGVIRAVQESGKKYPDEIGIIAISNGFFPGLYFPEITYVETNGAKLGNLAFKQMMLCINNDILPGEVYAESKLIEGGSI